MASGRRCLHSLILDAAGNSGHILISANWAAWRDAPLDVMSTTICTWKLAVGSYPRHLGKSAVWWTAITKCSPLCSPLCIPLNRRICCFFYEIRRTVPKWRSVPPSPPVFKPAPPLVRRVECVPYKTVSKPMLSTQRCTSWAYWRYVVMTSEMLTRKDAAAIGRGALAPRCAICHGPQGVSDAHSPNLAGQFAAAT
jgi:cytochrome c553